VTVNLIGRSLSAAGVDDRGVNGGRVMVNGGNKDDVTPRRSTSSTSLAASINYPDNQQVFVGNLPQHLTDHDLIEFFERELFVLHTTLQFSSSCYHSNESSGRRSDVLCNVPLMSVAC